MPPTPDPSAAVPVPARFADGSDADPALDVLRAAGWTLVADPDANIHARNPDGTVYAGWLPEVGAWTWQVQYTDSPFTQPVWTADFSQDTPTAAVAAYLAALADEPAHAPDPFTPPTGPGGPPCPDTDTAHAMLTAAGWEAERLDAQRVEARHEDEDLLVAYGPLPPKLHVSWPRRHGPSWVVLCTVGNGGPEVWRAVFDGDAPMRAVAAFLAAVTDPAPVTRNADELRPDVRDRYA